MVFRKRCRFRKRVIFILCLTVIFSAFTTMFLKTQSTTKIKGYIANAWTDIKFFVHPPDPMLYDVSWQQSENFKFIIDHPNICWNASNTTNGELFLLTIVPSAATKESAREAIRRTWGSVKEINGRKILTMFLISDNQTDKKRFSKIKAENEKFGDLIVANFMDEYKNLTLKTVMAFKWTSLYCPQAVFMLKTDDDTFVNYRNLVSLLESSPRRNVTLGHLMDGLPPVRKGRSKWYMPPQLFPKKIYPPFLSGTGYVMSWDVVQMTYNISLYTRLLHLEDVYVGICLEKLKIIPKHYENFHKYKNDILKDPCLLKDALTAHRAKGPIQVKMWKMINEGDLKKCSNKSTT
ncbi:beta-1,3-galactosyltransferase 1-like [Ptychodera flava]|uniref:beta-1,3-galactosyltransferase 1-like n=1 Tax=Ptychodera flava TaxID=63121 RepID=UPI003969FC0D